MVGASREHRTGFSLIKVFPALSTIILTLLSLGDLPILNHLPVNPAFHLIAIFFWAFQYPSLLPLWVTFVAGLIVDSVSLSPLGTHAVLFLLFQLTTMWARNFMQREQFSRLWLAFTLYTLVFYVLAYFAFHLLRYGESIVSPHIVAIQWLSSAICYPPIHVLLLGIFRHRENRRVKRKRSG